MKILVTGGAGIARSRCSCASPINVLAANIHASNFLFHA